MQINYTNDGIYNKIYPVTISENVKLNIGKNLEEWKQEVDEDFNNIEDDIQNINNRYEDDKKINILWQGNSVAGSGFNITPSKKLSDCKNGWLLAFKLAGNSNNYNYQHIPKEHVSLTSGTDRGVKCVLGSLGGTIVQKYMYIYDDKIIGHSSNSSTENEKMELFSVAEY